jgi:hypothetical protein
MIKGGLGKYGLICCNAVYEGHPESKDRSQTARAQANEWHRCNVRNMVLLHDNARPHSAAKHTCATFWLWLGLLFSSTLQSGHLDLAPSDFHSFTHLEQFYGGTRIDNGGNDEETKNKVKDWVTGLAADFYDVAYSNSS